MSRIGLTTKQKSSIIKNVDGSYLKSAVSDEGGTPGNWTNIIESIDILNPKKQLKPSVPMNK